MKITIIDFAQYSGCRIDYATHYYVNGRRIDRNTYYRCYSCSDILRKRGWEYDRTECRSDKNRNGVSRNYTIMYFKKTDPRNVLEIMWG